MPQKTEESMEYFIASEGQPEDACEWQASAMEPKTEVSCHVSHVLSGVEICTLAVSSDTTVADLKREIALVVNEPAKLLALIFDNDVVMDDQSRCFPSTSGEVSARVMKLRLATACTTQDDFLDVLSTLTSQGPDALVDHVEDVVSLLEQTPAANVATRPIFHAARCDFTADYKVHIAACEALQSLGPRCAKYALGIVAALPVIITKERANLMCKAMAYSGMNRYRFGYDRSSDMSFLSNTSGDNCLCVLSNLSSVFSSMGSEGLMIIVDHFQKTFETADESHKGLALMSIARAMLPFTASHSRYISWFVSFLRERLSWLSLFAVQCLIQIAKCQELQPALEEYIPEVLSLLSRPIEADYKPPNMLYPRWGGFTCSSVLSSAACKLLSKLGDRVGPHSQLIVSTFVAITTEAACSAELDRFQRAVVRKTHGAFAAFLKEKSSTVASFSVLFNSLGYDGQAGIMSHSTEIFRTAGPCQQALMLLCMARPWPTFTKAHAAYCASWITPFLGHPSWQVRACAIVCIQRLMAGYMGPEPHVHSIAALLSDPTPFVRQLAATAIGCLGRNAVRYEKTLLLLLKDSCPSVRYAALVTLGGMMALACAHIKAIASHLSDRDTKCRMAALRALKCMGKTASPFRHELKSWQQLWYARVTWPSNKLEPISARALLFPDIPLRELFKGHAPLGHRFAGSKIKQDARRQRYTAAMQTAEASGIHFLEHGIQDTQESVSTMLDAIAVREAREYAREVQVRHHAAYDVRRRKKKKQSADRRLLRQEGSMGVTTKLPRHQKMKDRWSRTCSEFAVDWVVPTARRHCHSFVHLDWQ